MVFLERKTAETAIKLKMELYGQGQSVINTGCGFFDHMLTLFSRHGFLDLELEAKGDLKVDEHHTVEDVGIVIGQALRKTLGDKGGIIRYGEVTMPMDEVLIQVVLDLSGRPYYSDNFSFNREKVGDFPVELTGEFFRSLANNAGLNLHIRVIRNGNTHHLIEACFKAFGKALDTAVSSEPRLQDKPLSTKGSLEEGE